MAKFGKDVFLALAAIGWADGNLDANEAAAIIRAATEEGLAPDAIAEIEAAAKSPITLEFLDRSAMGKDDRLFVYAMAAWVARIDGQVTADEVAALAELGRLLGVPERPRQHADAIAQEIAEAGGDRPDRYDLPRLRQTITERLIEAQRLRSESR